MTRKDWIGLALAAVAFSLAHQAAEQVAALAAQRVGVRWASSVDAGARARAEQAHGLQTGEDVGGGTWLYRLSDQSPHAIAALVRDPIVEDTSHIDRRALAVQLDRQDLPGWLRFLVESRLFPRLPAVLAVGGLIGLLVASRGLASSVRGAVSGLMAATRNDDFKRIALCVLVALLFGAVFHRFIRHQGGHQINDFGSHLAYADEIRSIQDIRSPHFLFQLLISSIRYAFGLSSVDAAVTLLAATYGGMALLLFGELGRRRVLGPGYYRWAIVPALLIASHVFLFTLHRRNLYWGYFVPVMYSNPTQQLNKLFALWIYLRYAARMLGRGSPSLQEAPALALLCVLSALAKPSFLIVFLPVAGLYGLRDVLARRWRHVSVFVAGIALPSVAILLWQARAMNNGAGVSIQLAPFAVFDFVPTLYKLPSSLAFPIAVALVAFHVEAQKTRLQFLWLFMTLALIYTLGLAETGANMRAGNFVWSGQTAVFLAYVESALFLLTVPPRTRGRRVAWAVFALHVACGVFWYASIFLFPRQDTWL